MIYEQRTLGADRVDTVRITLDTTPELIEWISMVDNNVWEPGAAGVYDSIWKEVV